MKVAGILFTIAVIVLIYIIIRYLFKESTALTGILSGETMKQFSASQLATNGSVNANNFAYSLWFYVQDWNYRYGEQKVLFGRMNSPTSTTTSGSIPGIPGQNPSPVVYLDALENNVVVALGCYPGANQIPVSSTGTTTPPSLGDAVTNSCLVSNVPIQRWVNLLISVYGRTLDVYMDGKLVKTCLLPGIAMINTSTDIYLTPGGGFNGWTSKLQYFPNPINPQQAWNIYTKGYGTSLFNTNYQIKVSFDENGSTKSSFTI